MKKFKISPIIDKNFNINLVIKNIFQLKKLNEIKICFSLIYSIKSLKNAKIVNQIGRYYEITPLIKSDLKLNEKFIIKINLKNNKNKFINLSSGPEGIFCLNKFNKKINLDVDNLKFLENFKSKKYPKIINKKSDMPIIPYPSNFKLIDKQINCVDGFDIRNKKIKSTLNKIKLIIDSSKYFKINKNGIKLTYKKIKVDKENYKILINDNVIEIQSSTNTGIFYALISILQILIINNHYLKKGYIEDYPRFSWRGMHLDCARQYYPIKKIKSLLNLMSLYKMNRLHLHLTDNEAWRINLKSFPNLAKDLSFRGYEKLVPPTYGSGFGPRGGFYRKKELKDLIQYSKKLSIEIIPEIDIPSHSWALVNHIEQLQEKEDQSWDNYKGTYKNNTLNPGIAFTWKFIKKVFKEVSEIFPHNIIHIGFDEIPKNSWTKSPAVKKIMKKNKINNISDVKNYFVRRIQNILYSHNKKIGIWNEGIDNNNSEKIINNDCLVFAWQNEQVAVKAIKKGFKVILCPAQKCYFDMAYNSSPEDRGLVWAGTTETKQVFEWEPINNNLKRKIDKIYGIQGQLWSETITNINFMDIMINPRLLALSEVAWSKSNKRNWNNFKSSLKKNMKITKKIGWDNHKF